MKTNTPKSAVLFLLAALCGVLAVAGCASVNSSNREALLSAAGFQVRTPQTDKQKQIYAEMPSYKVERISVNGKVVYVYKNEAKGVAYVGDEPAYQRYQQLAIQQNIAQQNYAAAQMNQQMSTNWYGAYGPYYGVGPRFR